jgi:hypothetical protein
VDLDIATSGVVFLPLKHTELMSGGTPPERRHFIEFFKWVPGQAGRTWTLHWQVVEVVRERLVDAVHADLGTISAERPPTDSAVDTSSIARLRVNDDGLAMWEVLQGPDRGSEFIETETERREASERARVRKAAEERVNWDVVRDVRRLPALAFSNSDGWQRPCVRVVGRSDRSHNRARGQGRARVVHDPNDVQSLIATPRARPVCAGLRASCPILALLHRRRDANGPC